MTINQKKKLYLTILALAVFAIFTVAVTVIDSQPVSAVDYTGTGVKSEEFNIGFASVNLICSEKIGYSATWNTIADIMGYIALFTVFIFGCTGAYQLFVSRKNLFLVDSEIITLGLYYLLVLSIYFIFTKVSINMRPVITAAEKGLEPSYPSSHTILGISVMITAAIVSRIMLKNKTVSTLISVVCILLAILAVISRLLSGLHWITDIIGGMLLSAALVSFWSFLRDPVNRMLKVLYDKTSKNKKQTVK